MPLGAYRSLRKSGASAEKDRLVKSYVRILGAFIVFFFVAMFLLTTGCTEDCKNTKLITVVKVGGCSEGGYCGVMYDDGSTDTIYTPVEGQRVEVCK